MLPQKQASFKDETLASDRTEVVRSHQPRKTMVSLIGTCPQKKKTFKLHHPFNAQVFEADVSTAVFTGKTEHSIAINPVP